MFHNVYGTFPSEDQSLAELLCWSNRRASPPWVERMAQLVVPKAIVDPNRTRRVVPGMVFVVFVDAARKRLGKCHLKCLRNSGHPGA